MQPRTNIHIDAANRASQVRRELGIGPFAPICIYDRAEERGLEVLFTKKFSRLEGIYRRPQILVSALRPAGRQAYTCAHELGHHEYGHGLQLDEIQASSFESIQAKKEEVIADTFAAHFLMPKFAIQRAFTQRNWDIKCVTERQIYTISKYFGVSYSALIHHMHLSLRLITRPVATR